MKTITLTDAAYQRLKDWKQDQDDSFSKVVLKVVPERGAFRQLLNDLGRMPPLGPTSATVMEVAAQWGDRTDTDRQPWTS